MDKIIETLYEQYLVSRTVTTDSRKITPGCIFFALKGEHFNGNDFALLALQQGAACCVVDDPKCAADTRCVLVPDVLKALQDLARCHREHLDIPIIGVTGTNGKTTTKELLHAVLSMKYRTHATAGNFNNHLGVPLTLLSLPADTQIAIIEMGANHPGEIDFLCAIAQPTCGLITNVGKAHLEGFGSFEGVVHTKTELYRSIAARKGLLFVNADNPVLLDQASLLATLAEVPSQVPGYIPGFMPVLGACHQKDQISVLTYGHSEEADIKGSCVGADPYLRCYFEQEDNVYSVQTQLLGAYNFDNVMAAVAVGTYYNVDSFDIKTALEQYEPANKRSQYKKTQRNVLFLDCYNANPSSMKVALDNFAALSASRKVPMLGAMKELGAESEREHEAIVTRLRNEGYPLVLLVGKEFAFARDLEHFRCFDTVEEAADFLRANPIQDASILLKGSNSTKMWQLEELL